MKKIITLAIIVLLSVNLNAQSIFVAAGATGSNQDFSNSYWVTSEAKKSMITTPTFAFGVNYLDKKKFFLTTYVSYIQKGASFTIKTTDAIGNPTGEYKEKYTFDYTSLNFIYQHKIVSAKSNTLFAGVGLKTDFLLSQKGNLPDANKMVWGCVIDAGVSHSFGKFSLGAIASYSPLFTKTYKDVNTEISDRTGSVVVTLGYKLK